MKIWEAKDLGLNNLTLTEKEIKPIANDSNRFNNWRYY